MEIDDNVNGFKNLQNLQESWQQKVLLAQL
jgi:hypothetical protein